MATAEIILDQRRAKKDGSYPIRLRLTAGKKWLAISVGYSVKPSDWNPDNRRVKKTHDRNIEINREISRHDAAAWDVIGDLNKIHHKVDVEEIRSSVLKRLKPTYEKGDFIAYAEDQIKFQRKYGKIGTATWYRTSINSLKKFLGEDRLLYHQFDVRLVRSYENWMSMNKLSTNARSNYHRALRAIFNKAISEDQVSGIQNPYMKFKIKSENTRKRAISLEQLKAIVEVDLSDQPKLKIHRDMFLFSFYTRGTNLRDILQLRQSNILDGRLNYRRAKTGRMFSIKLTVEANDVVSRYKDKENTSSDPLLFPILQGKDLEHPESAHRAFKQASKIHNECLKEIAKKAEIDVILTSYVARHSWATLAKKNNVSSANIRDAMGHQSLSSTEVYLQALGNEELDEINERITKL